MNRCKPILCICIYVAIGTVLNFNVYVKPVSVAQSDCYAGGLPVSLASNLC